MTSSVTLEPLFMVPRHSKPGKQGPVKNLEFSPV